MGNLRTDVHADRALVGEKAANLAKLMSMGFRVPESFVIHQSSDLSETDELVAWLASATGEARRWRLAVRSSSAIEDTMHESKAGHFLTELGEFDHASLLETIQRVQCSGPQMAVIVQPVVNARWAGVLFSCDPLTFGRDRPLVAWTAGLAAGLVSGEVEAQHLRATSAGEVLEGAWPSNLLLLHELLGVGVAWEQAYAAPADIEWAIDQEDRLWVLQARPVVMPRSGLVLLDSKASFDRLPSLVASHHKIRLRKAAAEVGVNMAPAAVETWCGALSENRVDLAVRLGRAAAASVVLLHPERVNNSIVREFAPVRGADVAFWTQGCRRYAIRRYPSVSGTLTAKRSVLTAGLASSWTATSIIQAVWDAFATGIVRRTDAGYIIDVGLGHFVPKGVVPTSTLVLDRNKSVVSTIWREQETAYRFLDGHVVTETPPEEQLELDEFQMADIAATLDPLFDVYPQAALEFGLLHHPPGFRVYLIDIAEGDQESVALEFDMIHSGVISAGTCRGRILRTSACGRGAIDTHFYDRSEAAAIESEQVVIAAESASIDLLPYVHAPGVVGFVLERGSMLAHLAIVLRERGIPAIALEDKAAFASLVDGTVVEIDAASRGLSRADRLRILPDAEAMQ